MYGFSLRSGVRRVGTALSSVLLLATAGAQAAPTHLGVGHGKLVHLEVAEATQVDSVCGGFEKPLRAVRANGVVDSKQYFVPAGQELIILDISWVAQPRDFTDWPEYRAANLKLSMFSQSGDRVKDSYYVSPPVATRDDTKALIGAREQLLTGLRIGPRRTLCASGRAVGGQGAVRSSSVINVVNGHILGYLVSR